ncbi:hypothetical protein VOLCADRAFT_100363 [Volvox carteri f. nagariensis]|uniref:Uncharacterized protein n=1 Tax=Volvox carteri f. nagariensis TaxID=3068 RepID=D8UK27_VOLCA|nr:uncharacterized protein VOLCADRAFT_100363 [Volvox carteri f. nagariensis]EFJ39936.1 hypothetical protein VOLCADRAFT_100363 [Volvox carteri f. nagariensis]|eukprot:XP_002959017.1 hypothetical protein VOLCADRAFT_100363 [Volvox carteri f. nagariensis]
MAAVQLVLVGLLLALAGMPLAMVKVLLVSGLLLPSAGQLISGQDVTPYDVLTDIINADGSLGNDDYTIGAFSQSSGLIRLAHSSFVNLMCAIAVGKDGLGTDPCRA